MTEMGDPNPRVRGRAPEARGLLGGNEAQAGYRWQGEPIKGSLWRRASFESAATEFVLQFDFAAHCAEFDARSAASTSGGGPTRNR